MHDLSFGIEGHDPQRDLDAGGDGDAAGDPECLGQGAEVDEIGQLSPGAELLIPVEGQARVGRCPAVIGTHGIPKLAQGGENSAPQPETAPDL